MKLAVALVSSAAATFRETFSHKVERNIAGEWVDTHLAAGRYRRQAGTSNFAPIAAMIAYMQGKGNDGQDPATQNMDSELEALETKYTSYGCYCWAKGTSNIEDLGAGSANVDWNDKACTDLYRCYACVNIDYGKKYTELSYDAIFSTDVDGNRKIDCSGAAQSDGEHICQCDAAFAERIAFNEDQCTNNGDPIDEGKSYCIDESFRTATGGGSFTCPQRGNDKTSPMKEKCCGIYPERRGYAVTKECCQTNGAMGDIFNIVSAGTCDGTVVESEPGNPHSYVPVV